MASWSSCTLAESSAGTRIARSTRGAKLASGFPIEQRNGRHRNFLRGDFDSFEQIRRIAAGRVEDQEVSRTRVRLHDTGEHLLIPEVVRGGTQRREVLAERAIAGRARRSRLSRTTYSVAMCSAAAALPPFPAYSQLCLPLAAVSRE